MVWMLILVNLTVSPIEKQIIGYYPDLQSCQTEADKIAWYTPLNSKAICTKNNEVKE